MRGDIIFSTALDVKFHQGRPAAAFVLRGFDDRRDVGMLLQHLAQSFAEDAHAAAVNHADARKPGEESAVDELFDFAAGLVDGLADHVDLAGDVARLRFPATRKFLGRARPSPESRDRPGAGQHFGDVVARDLHLHRAHLDFEMIVVDLARDSGRASGGLQLDGIAFGDVLDQLRLGVRIALVGAGGVGDDGGIELLAEFAAQLGDAAFGVFGKLLRGGAILNGIDRFAGVIFEIAQQALELLFHLADFGLLVFLAFRGELRFSRVRVPASRVLQAQAFAFGIAKFGVQLVEELADVAGLRSEARRARFR